MSRKRSISSDISSDVKLLDLAAYGPLPLLLYTWAIPHADDWGRMTGETKQFKALVCPGLEVTISDMDTALDQIAALGLWDRYEVGGRRIIAFPSDSWFKHQSYIPQGKRDSDSSQFPSPQNTAKHRKTPQNTSTPTPSPTPIPSFSPSPKSEGGKGAPESDSDSDPATAILRVESEGWPPLDSVPTKAQLQRYAQSVLIQTGLTTRSEAFIDAICNRKIPFGLIVQAVSRAQKWRGDGGKLDRVRHFTFCAWAIDDLMRGRQGVEAGTRKTKADCSLEAWAREDDGPNHD